jgi:SnoaL-like domain
MNAQEIGTGLVELCKQGKFMEAAVAYYAEDIISLEPMGDSRESQGMDAIRAKMEWFDSNFEVHGVEVDGPYVNEPCFIVKFVLDVTNKHTNVRSPMNELGLYSVHDGKIVHERFFNL